MTTTLHNGGRHFDPMLDTIRLADDNSADVDLDTNLTTILSPKSRSSCETTSELPYSGHFFGNCINKRDKINDDDTMSEQPLYLSYLSLAGSNKSLITINVGGMKYQTWSQTLDRFPDTLLGSPSKRQLYFDALLGEYFFDRHRQSFDSILYYYQSCGRLQRPVNVAVDVFVKELAFFEMGDEVVQKFWTQEGYRKPKEKVLPKSEWQRWLWLLMEQPDSSVAARIVAFLSIFVIVLSTASFCLETVPELQFLPNEANASCHGNHTTSCEGSRKIRSEFENPFFIIESVCIFWFTVEFTVRFISCPSKCKFCKSFLNVVDFFAILPFYINFVVSDGGGSAVSFAVLRVIRLVRVFRIFKLSRHSRGLQILGMTFRASVQEFCLLVFFLLIGLVLFSSAVYFAESGIPDSKFVSIPETFWYSIVTMTTVGYGDLTPTGGAGKFVGSLCAISGVLVLALPVPVIVSNFKHFYHQEQRLQYMQQTAQLPN